MTIASYHIAINWAWRSARRVECNHARWEWFGQAGPLRVIKLRGRTR